MVIWMQVGSEGSVPANDSKKQQSLRVVFETQLALPQSVPGSRCYINGLRAPEAHAYGST